MSEIEKYRWIYGLEDHGGYGSSNHGKDAHKLIVETGCKSLVDVGCGHNEFAGQMRDAGIFAVGVDFACPDADVVADAVDLPFTDDEFDLVTAFDVLEHIPPDQIIAALREFSRVARGYVVSIAYTDSRSFRDELGSLHPTVRPKGWWIETLSWFGTVNKSGPYLYGGFKKQT